MSVVNAAQAKPKSTQNPYEGYPLSSNYATVGDGWDGPGQNAVTIGYRFVNSTGDLTLTTQQSEVLRAMNLWSSVAQINWVPVGFSGQSKSIDIGWFTGDHGDGSPFDGPSGVLAHGFYPAPPNPEPIGGDLHFDDAETWTSGTLTGTNLFTVAIHELGHSLGLNHTTDDKGIMYAYYAGGSFGNALAPDDISAIRSLYAPRYSPLTAHVRGTHTWRSDLTIKVGVKSSVGGPTLYEKDVFLRAGGDLDNFDFDEIDLSDAMPLANGTNDWYVSVQDSFASDTGVLQEFSLRFGALGNFAFTFSPDTGALVDNGIKYAYIQNFAIPEPAALSLVVVAGGLLGRRGRRRRAGV
jgi:hypothetical protein